MRVHAFFLGGERCDIAEFDPLEQPGTRILIPYFAYLIEHPRGTVLFDTGARLELQSDPRAYFGASADLFDFALRAGEDVASQLSRAGVAAGDLEHVVQSHLHYDHAGGLGLFPRALVHVQRAELAHALSVSPTPELLYLRGDYEGDVRWHELEGEHDLFGDGRVVCIPTPGHSPGHQSLLIRLPSQTIFLLADATYRVQRMRERTLPPNVLDPEAMLASWDHIEEIERRENARLISTHDLDFATSVRLAPNQWYE
jgi:glyoxylase-like metal-dependent hydrolase (beta-lactamase superfamily II)